MTPQALLDSLEARLVTAPPPGVSSAYAAGFFARRRGQLLLHLRAALRPPVASEERIITLNMGLGRDSLAMLALLIEGQLVAEGRALRVADVDAVVFSDPGFEWAHTYALLPRVRRMCALHGLRLIVLQKPDPAIAEAYLRQLPPPGDPARAEAIAARPWREAEAATTIEERAEGGWYHLRPGILEDYQSRQTIAARGSKDCTVNHKIEPIRKLINDLALARFGVGNRAWGALVRAGQRRPHLSLVGIAADELPRLHLGHPQEGGDGPWFVTEAYPLVELGVSKADEDTILIRHGLSHARKSGCAMCPFQPVGWYWALRETDPEGWAAVVEYERVALARNPRMFIVGQAPISEAVAAWRAKHPRATVDEVLGKTYARCGVG